MVADEVVARARALRAGTRWVGIDGFGAAGKTTLAERIAAAVPRAVLVHLDDLQGAGITEWDWTALRRDIVEPLLAGRPARYAVRSWGETKPRGHAEVPVGALVVVEGVSALRREADVPWDLTVWVDTAEPVRRARREQRDGPEVRALWQASWLPSERAYAARERPWERADLVVSGDAAGSGTMERS